MIRTTDDNINLRVRQPEHHLQEVEYVKLSFFNVIILVGDHRDAVDPTITLLHVER